MIQSIDKKHISGWFYISIFKNYIMNTNAKEIDQERYHDRNKEADQGRDQYGDEEWDNKRHQEMNQYTHE